MYRFYSKLPLFLQYDYEMFYNTSRVCSLPASLEVDALDDRDYELTPGSDRNTTQKKSISISRSTFFSNIWHVSSYDSVLDLQK